MRTVTILAASGGELANQLWNYASVYAYALERGFALKNPSFYEYGASFALPSSGRWFDAFFFRPFKGYTKRKNALKRRIWRKIYTWYVALQRRRFGKRVIALPPKGNDPFYLPPTETTSTALLELERDGGDLYLDGWLFRNPVGLGRYREQIQGYFRPRADIGARVEEVMTDLRSRYTRVIGLHVRQGDYRTWKNGRYLIPQERVRQIMEEYLLEASLDREQTGFLITSDGAIDQRAFSGLRTFVSPYDAVTDLFLLANADVVIGSNSSFGAFAAYYGNVPFVVMQTGAMDWAYYRGKKNFFINEYSTMPVY